MKNLSDKQKALNKILLLLARRDHSEKELRSKIKDQFPPEAINTAIEEAKNKSWIKPPQFLSIEVAKQLMSRNKGELYIQNYLRRKGLPPVTIREEEEKQRGLDLLNLKFPGWSSFTLQDKQKPARFLQNRGFTVGTIKSLLFSHSLD